METHRDTEIPPDTNGNPSAIKETDLPATKVTSSFFFFYPCRRRQVASCTEIPAWLSDSEFLLLHPPTSSIFIFRGLHMARSESWDFDKYHDKFKTVRLHFSNCNCIIIESWARELEKGGAGQRDTERVAGGRAVGPPEGMGRMGNGNYEGNNWRINLTKCRSEEPGKEKVDPTCVWQRTSQGLLTWLFLNNWNVRCRHRKLCVLKGDGKRVGAKERVRWKVTWVVHSMNQKQVMKFSFMRQMIGIIFF